MAKGKIYRVSKTLVLRQNDVCVDLNGATLDGSNLFNGEKYGSGIPVLFVTGKSKGGLNAGVIASKKECDF